MQRKRFIEDPVAGVTLLRKADVCRLLGVSSWTIDQWRRRERFPQPIYVTDGAPMRFRLTEVQRWLDARAARRRKPIHRGRLRRGAAGSE